MKRCTGACTSKLLDLKYFVPKIKFNIEIKQ